VQAATVEMILLMKVLLFVVSAGFLPKAHIQSFEGRRKSVTASPPCDSHVMPHFFLIQA
jgi:hypothetical protein